MASLSEQDKKELLADAQSFILQRDFAQMNMRSASLTSSDWLDFLNQMSDLTQNVNTEKDIIRGDNFLL